MAQTSYMSSAMSSTGRMQRIPNPEGSDVYRRHNSDNVEFKSSLMGLGKTESTPLISKESRAGDLSRFVDDGFIANYQTNLNIIRPYYSAEYAANFKVCNPKKSAKGGFIEYQVYGISHQNFQFCINRRYREFYALRNCLIERFPGMYVPAMPSKKKTGNTNVEFLQDRCFHLNLFLK